MEIRTEQTIEREIWDRLFLLLISVPKEGYEDLHREISLREIDRLNPVHEERCCSDG
jgi:hypothetical protein